MLLKVEDYATFAQADAFAYGVSCANDAALEVLGAYPKQFLAETRWVILLADEDGDDDGENLEILVQLAADLDLPPDQLLGISPCTEWLTPADGVEKILSALLYENDPDWIVREMLKRTEVEWHEI